MTAVIPIRQLGTRFFIIPPQFLNTVKSGQQPVVQIVCHCSPEITLCERGLSQQALPGDIKLVVIASPAPPKNGGCIQKEQMSIFGPKIYVFLRSAARQSSVF
jgi:hypothetical protein